MTRAEWLARYKSKAGKAIARRSWDACAESLGVQLELIFKSGDRVHIKAPDNPLMKYEGYTVAKGTVLRLRNGKVRVQVDHTSSQDTEGHDSYSDFDVGQLTLISDET